MNHDEIQNTSPGAEPVSPESGPAPEASAAPASEISRRVPEDIDVPWGVRDLILFLLFAFAALIFLSQAMGYAAMKWYAIKPQELERFAQTNAGFVTVRQALWSALLMLYLFLQVRLRFALPFWRGLGWRRLVLADFSPTAAYVAYVAGGSAFAIVVQFASAQIGRPGQLPIDALFRDRMGVLLLMALGIVVAPVVEETVFRGYLYPVLARRLGIAGGIVGTGVLFGLIHAPQLWGGWGQVGLLVLVGIVFTYARARSGTVLASYLLHLGYNGILFFGFFLATKGLRQFPVP